MFAKYYGTIYTGTCVLMFNTTVNTQYTKFSVIGNVAVVLNDGVTVTLGGGLAGDFMSAASFLGISAQIYADGYDGLIYSIGFLVGWPILLFLIIFMWTPPHFWALAIVRMKDYEKAGVPMLPVVRGERVIIAHHDTRIEEEDHVIMFLADRRQVDGVIAGKWVHGLV